MYDRHLFGLDLGQAQDYTALAVAQQSTQLSQPRSIYSYAFRHLQRWPLGTSYPQIVADLAAMLAKVPNPELVVDATGCGRPVLDMFRYAGLPGHVEPITITGGTEVTKGDHGGYHVPKRDLVAAVQAALQTKRLKISSALREAVTLRRELETFKDKVNIATGHESFEAWRERDHDDLVLAVALALWVGENRCCWVIDPSTVARKREYESEIFHAPKGVFLEEEPEEDWAPDPSPHSWSTRIPASRPRFPF